MGSLASKQFYPHSALSLYSAAIAENEGEGVAIDIGKDLGFYTPLGHHWCYELSSYNHLIRLTPYHYHTVMQ